MLPRPNRLRTEREFHTAYRSGRPRRSRLFSLWVRPNQLPHHRYGFVISTKVDKRATKRNVLKRRLREFFPALTTGLPTADFVLVARPGAAAALVPDLKKDIDQLFQPYHAPRRH